jgi:hypothetical protein
MDGIDHIFIGDKYNLFNEMYPFYELLADRTRSFYTAEIAQEFSGKQDMAKLPDHVGKNKKAIIYASVPRHLEESSIAAKYDRVKLVRMYHGITQPWSTILDKDIRWDVVVESSELAAENWQRYTHPQRVEVIGWPKAEEVMARLEKEDLQVRDGHVLVAIHWSKKQSGFEQYHQIIGLNGYTLTYLVHPNTSNNLPALAQRRISSEALEQVLSKEHITADLSSGALHYMLDKPILIGAESSPSVEWLLFDRPILFLLRSEHLNFGAYIGDQPLEKLIEETLTDESQEFKEIRHRLRDKLTSHLDGEYRNRFLGLVEELEKDLK